MKKLYLLLAITLLSFKIQAQRTMTWYNNSDYTIEEMYISMIDTEIWGDNLLEAPLKPESQAQLMFPYCEDYNIKVINSKGEECFIDQLYICTDLVDLVADDWIKCFGKNEE